MQSTRPYINWFGYLCPNEMLYVIHLFKSSLPLFFQNYFLQTGWAGFGLSANQSKPGRSIKQPQKIISAQPKYSNLRPTLGPKRDGPDSSLGQPNP